MVEARNSFVPGEIASFKRTITQADIDQYAELLGDTNPVHLDEAYAQSSHFEGRIAHGMLVAGLISTLLGTKLPGPGAVYLSQSLNFKAPVRPGDALTTTATVKSWRPERGILVLETAIANQEDTKVIEGEAALIMSSYLR